MQRWLWMTLLSLSLCLTAPAQEECKCSPPRPGETTHWGGNELVVEKESKVYRSLRGVVYIGDSPLRDALVEVFDHPDHLLLTHPRNEEEKAKQRRIAACKTGDDGEFCFVKLPKGKYEIRASIDKGFNVTHVWVLVDPGNRGSTNARIELQMRLGT